MFCKSCGKEIKDTDDFCSFCGIKIVKTQNYGISNSLVVSNFQTLGDVPQTSKKGSFLKNRKMFLIIILLLFFLCVFTVLLVINSQKEYPLEGEWKSDDLTVLPEVIRGYVKDEGYPVEIADIVVEMLALDDIGEDLIIVFTEDNRILLIMNGITVGSDLLSYQKIGENKILLQFEWNGTILGTSIPISAGYTGEYKVDNNKLSIDFFGYDVRMTRQSGREKKSSNSEY